MRKSQQNSMHWAISALMLASACTPLADGAQKMGQNTKQMVDDTRDAWSDVFTYTPKKKEQLPQTRYCYKTMTDVVCYDSVQPTLTSHLDGYQDGENISWVQPGGGSLGVSGGMPTAAPGADHAQVSPMAQAAVDVTSNTVPASTPDASATVLAAPSSASASATEKAPFSRKESPYVKPPTASN